MSQTPATWHTAFVLHRKPWKESSWLADFLVENEGRLRLVVRGARKNGKQGHAWMQPFMPLRIQWRGRSSLPTLTQAETDGRLLPLQGRNQLAGFYLNELLFKLLPERESSPRLFSLYHCSLQALTAADESDLLVILRRFELVLLEELGHGLDFQQPPADGWWVHDLNTGWQAAEPGQPGALHARQLQQLRGKPEWNLERARILRPLLQAQLAQLNPKAGEESRALLKAWMKLEARGQS